jgi:hypothetical protein
MSSAERRRVRRAHFVNERANPRDARIVVRLAKIHGAADLRVHLGAAQIFGGSFLADRRLHQRGASQKQSRAFGHQDVIAHHRKVRAPSDTHSHDRRDLRNTHRGHDGVVAKDPPKIVSVGENIFLERQKDSRGIDQINCGNAVFDCDILRANHFLRGHREKRTCFHGGVIGDDHESAPANFRESGDGSCARRAAPLLIHFKCRVDSQLKKLRTGINQFGDTLSRSEPAFLVLRFDCFRAAALADLFFLVLDFRQ